MAAYLDHAACYVEDLRWYADFFTAVFGMTVTRERKNPDGLRELWLSGGIQLCESPCPQNTDGRAAHLCLLVEDVEEARAAALAWNCSPMEKHHWVKLPDGLALELFPAREGVIETLTAMKKKK